MKLATAAITLYFVMNPLGSIPIVLSTLGTVESARRLVVLLREAIIAFLVLVLFLFFGSNILNFMSISPSSLRISGGIILFLIALRMILPRADTQTERQIGEPFVVPLAIPTLAGPSAMATVILFNSSAEHMTTAFYAVSIAALASTLTWLAAALLQRALGQKGIIAIERLMGMILTTVAVQMFLTGIKSFLSTPLAA